MKQRIRASALAFLAGLALQASAVGEPFGWRTRCVTNAPAFDPDHLPMLPPPGQWSWGLSANEEPLQPTATKVASSSTRDSALDIGLRTTLPAEDSARILELARGLDHDWRKCYRFVRDNIAYASYAGVLRGPVRTLLDREGNDADQAFLLLALLRASGYTATVAYKAYEHGEDAPESGFVVPLMDVGGRHPYNAASWLGVPETGDVGVVGSEVMEILAGSGREAGIFLSGDVEYLATDHFWVVLSLDGSNRSLDPSVKPTVRIPARNAASDMGYSRSTLIGSAGGTVSTHAVRNVSASGLARRLDAYTAALSRSWTNLNANAAASAFVGGASIVPQSDGEFFHGLVLGSGYHDFLRQSNALKDAFRASAALALGSISRTFFLDELGARNLWISFEASGTSYPRAILHLDDAVLSSEPAGSASSAAAMALSVEYDLFEPQQATYRLMRSLAHVYAIPVGFGGAHGGMRTWATDELARARTPGAASNDVRVLSRALQVAGQQWLAQMAMAARFGRRLSGKGEPLFYALGIAGQERTPFVDFKHVSLHGSSYVPSFDGASLFWSALEHAALDQLNGTNAPSVSTVRILELANAARTNVYFATSANWSYVQNALVGYTDAQKTAFQAAVNDGRWLLLPQTGTVTLNQWTGQGYIDYGPAGNGSYSTGMVIAGGMNGGMNGGFGTVDNAVDVAAYTAGTQPTTTCANGGVPETTQADPVAMPSGAFLDGRTDLLVAGGAPLAWTRHYDSRGRHDAGDLGRGWSHGFEASVTECADPDAVFGGGSVDAAIPTAVATVVVDDLLAVQDGLSAGERARRLMLAALTVQWWTKHLVGASVSVRLGARSLMFQRRPDGTYAPYPGVTASLTRANGVYTLTERLGSAYRFNAAGRLVSITDRSGNATTLTYSSGKLTKVSNDFGAYLNVAWNGGRISKVSDGAGHYVSYTYSSDGCLTKVSDTRRKNWTATYAAATHAHAAFALLTKKNPENQVVVRNVYNAFGQVTNQVAANGRPWTFGYAADAEGWDADPLGRRLTQFYTPEGRVRLRVDRDGAETVFVHDGHGHVVATTNALGRATTSVYDRRDNLVRTDEEGDGLRRTTSFAYDARNRLVATTNALGLVTTFAYDSKDRLLRTAFPDGSAVTNTWTLKGLLASERRLSPRGAVRRQTLLAYGSRGLVLTNTVKGVGLAREGLRTVYTYSKAGLPLTVRDANGHVTTFTYDAAGSLLTERAPNGGTTSRTYTDAGRLRTVTNALGRVTTQTWTASGKPASTQYPNRTVSTNRYDAADELASTTDPRGATTTFTRDAMGRVTARTTASGTDSMDYNALGLPVAVTDAAGVSTEIHYDGLGRPVAVRDALGSVRRTGYDLLDRATSTTDPRGKVRATAYDPRGRRVAAVRPSGAAEHFAYDGLGNLAAITNAGGHVYRMAYDALGRRLSATDATGRLVETNRYDGVGNLLSRTDGNGATVSNAYDVCDRLTRRTGPGFRDGFAYDAVGNLVTSSGGVARTTFVYSLRGWLANATSRVARVYYPLRWRYDTGGNITNVFYTPDKLVGRTYDAAGRLASVRDWLGHEWTFTHDGAGKPTGGTSPDGAAHGFAYDAAGRLSGWHAGALAGRMIERDAAGRRVRDTITAGPMPRSSVDRRADNTFDAADRLVSASVTYAVTNAPVAETYLYDGNGALTNFTSNGETRLTLSYDAQGRLSEVVDLTQRHRDTEGEPDSPCLCDSVLKFGYDGLGNRMIVNDRVFLPDHADPLKRPILECSTNGVPIRYYLWGNGRLLGFIDASGTLTVAHSDELGSVIALTTPDGTLLHTASYGPHGEDWGTTGTNPTPFAWLGGHGVQRIAAGRANDAAEGCRIGPLYLTRHRLYSATLHRFLSADPLGPAGGLNVYAYANGDPLSYIDPLGLCAQSGVSDFWSAIGSGLATAGEYTARGVDLAWNLGLQMLVHNNNLSPSAQAAVSRTMVGDLGSPLQRLGVYGNEGDAPAMVDPELVGAIWNAGAAATAYRNLGAKIPEVKHGTQGRATTDFISNVEVTSFGKVVGRGTVDVQSTVNGIKGGVIKERAIFHNKEGILPAQSPNYYREFVLPTPGIQGVGPQRIISGQGGEFYYTPDHYKNFIPLN